MAFVKSNLTEFAFLISLTLLPASCLEVDCNESDPGCNSVLALSYLICLPREIAGSAQGCPLQLSGTVTTIAGQAGANGVADGVGTAARFNFTNGSTHAGGFIYFADATNNRVRRLDLGTLDVATIVTGLSTPRDVVFYENNLYIANAGGHTILRYDLVTAALTTIAGTGGAGHADGAGTAAQFNFSQGITTDGKNLYVADSGTHSIRVIDLATSVVTTLAGVPNTAGYQDGAGGVARFNSPVGITTDGANLYVADNVTNQTIRKIIIATGFVTTIAGVFNSTGSADGVGAGARFNGPYAMTTDGFNLYITESGNDIVRRLSLSDFQVTTLTGQAGVAGVADGIGTAATHTDPRGITTDGVRLYVSDSNSHTIRRID